MFAIHCSFLLETSFSKHLYQLLHDILYFTAYNLYYRGAKASVALISGFWVLYKHRKW